MSLQSPEVINLANIFLLSIISSFFKVENVNIFPAGEPAGAQLFQPGHVPRLAPAWRRLRTLMSLAQIFRCNIQSTRDPNSKPHVIQLKLPTSLLRYTLRKHRLLDALATSVHTTQNPLALRFVLAFKFLIPFKIENHTDCFLANLQMYTIIA